MKTTLIGIGSYAMDTMIACPALPKEDSFALVREERILPGGSCANMLVSFAALGGKSRMLAKIGDDETGRMFSKTLKEDGVDISLLLTKPGGTSLHTYVFTTPDGTHSILVNPGDSMMALGPDELKPEILADADLFYSDFMPCAATVALAKTCRERGIPIVLCMQCAPSFMRSLGVGDAEIDEAMSLADLLISGREGLFDLTGSTDYRQGTAEVYARFLPSSGVICTAGSEGALWLDKTGALSAPAMKVRSVDSTGAGDSFLAALLYGYYHLRETRQAALEFAVGAGALKCTVPGPRLRVTEAELRGFIAAHR